MAQTVPFAGGDEIVVPFFIISDDGVLDVSNGTVRAEVWWRGRVRMQLTVGDGIEMVSSFPAEGSPHGYIRIVETESVLLPHGRVAFFRVVYVDPFGVTVSTDEDYLERRF